jgi:Trk K+ transport system NAD-binding subunit/mannitol/fructose-specific phosphotransferase system IIA component (Ntr-type)
MNTTDIEIIPIPFLSLEELNKLNAGKAEALVTMLSDEENYKICEIAYENYGTENLIVRVNKRTNLDRFNKLGALIVDPATAIVSLLDHFVRSPSATSLLLGMEKGQDVVELELRNPNLDGLAIRDLRLPLDVHILSVRRDEQILMSYGYTRLKLGDWLTIVGSVESLEQVALRFDVDRETELVHIVEKVTPPELTTRTLETEVQQLIRDKNEQPKTRFEEYVDQSIVIDISGRIQKEEFFRLVADKLSKELKKDSGELLKLLIDREKEQSTSIIPGLAIPHIIIEGDHKFCILLARCKEGIIFSESLKPVYAVFVLVGTKDERNFHLQALSAIAEVVQDTHFEKRWMRAKSENSIREVVLNLSRERRQV